MVYRPQDRRGVVILIVLSLLVLFVLLVVTFAIVAGQYRRAAQAVGRREWLGEDPQKTADRVMYSLVREPNLNQLGSPFRGHALLTDVYGKSARGQVSGNIVQLAGGQIVQFDFNPGWTTTIRDSYSGYYNGSLLTFVDGPLKGTSTRVVGYANPSAGVYRMRIVNPLNDGTSILLPVATNTFVLNGKPFVGTGFGYDSTGSGPIRLTDEALKPNRTGDPLGTLNIAFLFGLANESYDAADYQNMILAAVAFDPDRGAMRVLPSFHREDLISYWMARDSGHSDTNGWNKLGGDAASRYTTVPAMSPTASPPNIYTNLSLINLNLRNKLVFRPMPWDHPNFTGSNAMFDAWSRTAKQIDEALTKGAVDLNGNVVYQPNEVAWDVDNDGDGIKDSIWIDPDLPIQTTEDGRVFRPLVAIHCVDMDGRLNVNAHGNYAHIPGKLPLPVPVPLAGAGGTSAIFPKGQGYGPPEVGLNALINDNTINGQYDLLLQSRYGTDAWPGHTGYDPLMQFKFYEYPGNYFASVFPRATHFTRYPYPVTSFEDLSAFGSNMDVRGLLACGVDHRGQPLYEGIYTPGPPPSSFLDQLTDSPYELNLNSPSAADAPFTVAELEKVLRYRDFDASTLKSRLTDLPNMAFLRDPSQGGPPLGPRNRAAVTTDSYDLPVPGVVAPDNYPGAVLPQTIVELLASRLSVANVNAEIAKMLSPDLMMGLRMDINRPLGNGRDDNGNGVVDDAHGVANPNLNESLGPEFAMNGANSTSPGMAIDHDNDGITGPPATATDTDAFLARHKLARYLYVLLMLLKDPGFYFDFDGNNGNGPEETAKVLAQWAINAVDFRDADSIMTPFEYDVAPFNGWDVDGNVATNEGGDRRVVWGCERPELLITETLAFHDVRTENLDEPPPPGTIAEGDPHPDQRLMPRGALFVELYNPWAGHDKLAGELYSAAPGGSWGVTLNRKNSADQPVWRLAIVESSDPDYLYTHNPERTVYFTDPVNVVDSADGGTQQVHYTEAGLAPLLPGRYAVVGSCNPGLGGSEPISPYVTTIGRRSDADETGGQLYSDVTRQIRLNPDPNPDLNQVEIRNNRTPPALTTDPYTVDPMHGSSPPPPSSPPDAQPAIAVPVDYVMAAQNTIRRRNRVRGTTTSPSGTTYEYGDISLSISEPCGGYDDTGFVETAAASEGEFQDPATHTTLAKDEPLDWNTLPRTSQTLHDRRRIHLQRLANPLAPYDADTNPYLTIDVMPADLTVFNGVDAAIGPGPTQFGCYQRGTDDRVNREFWHQPAENYTSPTAPVPPESVSVHRFGYELRHTLGYLNKEYEPGITYAAAVALPVPRIRPWTSTTVPFYVGAPDTTGGRFPFPWLAWNNRPYASPTELLMVPRSSCSRLLRDFSTCNANPGPTSAYDNQLGRFHHLLNFFYQSNPDPTHHPPPAPAPNLYRVFEYLRVPPKFAGTETRLNPSTASPHFGSTAAGTEMLHPPFNEVSAYREPGRINVNTIYDERVWNALWGPCDPANILPNHQQITFSDFVDNRRGYGRASGNIFAPIFALWKPSTTYFPDSYCQPTVSNGFCYRVVAVATPPSGTSGASEPTPWPTSPGSTITDGDVTWECRPLIPTFFASPYRAPGTSWLVPPDASGGSGLGRLEVDNTMLRTNRNVMGVTPPTSSEEPEYLNAFSDPPRHSDHNPYFSYQRLQRLSNLVTCRSNVYALWLTIGYFEVEQKLHPITGVLHWELGQEVGIDTGTVERHRAFYIIDRSIPVAFEPGQNHNVDKCVLLRRMIE